jgi:hypothetical protein
VAGAALNLIKVRRAAAFGDLDNDGRVDVVATSNNGPVRVLHNESEGGNWLSLVLPQSGARVALYRQGDPHPIWRSSHTDGSYLTANDPRVHFGLNGSTGVEKLVIEWPDGKQQEEREVAVNSRIILRRR